MFELLAFIRFFEGSYVFWAGAGFGFEFGERFFEDGLIFVVKFEGRWRKEWRDDFEAEEDSAIVCEPMISSYSSALLRLLVEKS